MTGLLKRHWVTTDGHRFVSVAAPVPAKWSRVRNDEGHLVYLSGSYSIVRKAYPRTGVLYEVFRDGVALSLSQTRSFADAKARAVQNAEGRDVINFAAKQQLNP